MPNLQICGLTEAGSPTNFEFKKGEPAKAHNFQKLSNMYYSAFSISFHTSALAPTIAASPGFNCEGRILILSL